MGSSESKLLRPQNRGRGERRGSLHLSRHRSNHTVKSKKSADEDGRSAKSGSGGGARTRSAAALSHLQHQGSQFLERIRRHPPQEAPQQSEELLPRSQPASFQTDSTDTSRTSQPTGADALFGDAHNRDAMVLAAAHHNAAISLASNGSNAALSSQGSGNTVNEAVQKIIDEVKPLSSSQQAVSPTHSAEASSSQKRVYPTEYQPQSVSERILMDLFTLPESDARRRKERDSHQRQHYLLKYIWRTNFNVPISSPSLIINWCCGPGIWLMEMAQEFPDCRMVGIDFENATLPSLSENLKNLSFHHVVIHEGRTGFEDFADNSADYVMMRDVWLVNSPNYRWIETLAEAFRVLKPGGWIEVNQQELNMHNPGPNMAKADKLYDKFFEKVGVDREITSRLGNMLKQAGFIHLDDRALELPLGEWSSIPGLKQTGYLNQDLMVRRFRNALDFLCEFNDINPKEAKESVEKGYAECEDKRTCMRWYYYAGQKPTTKP